MRYKAVVEDLLVNGHPVQILGNDLKVMLECACAMSKKHNKVVRVYRIEEQVVVTINPEGFSPSNVNLDVG